MSFQSNALIFLNENNFMRINHNCKSFFLQKADIGYRELKTHCKDKFHFLRIKFRC